MRKGGRIILKNLGRELASGVREAKESFSPADNIVKLKRSPIPRIPIRIMILGCVLFFEGLIKL
jgi:hypothetical protein